MGKVKSFVQKVFCTKYKGLALCNSNSDLLKTRNILQIFVPLLLALTDTTQKQRVYVNKESNFVGNLWFSQNTTEMGYALHLEFN